jgi:hypothetical protein
MVKGLGEVGQGRGDDLLRFAGAERIPVLGFADEVRGADAPVVEAAVDGEREVVVDPAVLEKVRDGVIDVGEHATAGQVQDGDILRVGVVVAQEHGEREPAQEVGNWPPLPLKRAEELGDPLCASRGILGSWNFAWSSTQSRPSA